MGPPDPPVDFLPTHVILWVTPQQFSLAPMGFIHNDGTSFMSPYLTHLASLLGTALGLPYGQQAAPPAAIYNLGGVPPLVSLGGVPCAPPPPMTLLSWGLVWGVSPMDSGLLRWQPFAVGGGAHVSLGGMPCVPLPPMTLDPEEDISAGSHLSHGV